MKISNKYLTASFKTKGAELISLKKGRQEYIWQADPAHWNRHAPVLFPIVGKLKDNFFLHNGEKYELGQHGFARDQEFSVIAHDTDTISFSLIDSKDTLKRYPFKFELNIFYRLRDDSLEVSYEIKNTGDQRLIFSIGAHPAFNCPMTPEEQRSDYWLRFDQQEEFITQRLSDGNFSGETEKISEGNEIPITNHLFDRDALVFKHLRSTQVSLHSKKRKWLTFHFSGFPYLGIWSKNAESPFICLEPWFGLADHKDHNQNLKEKEGIQILAAERFFSCRYLVQLH